MVFGAAGRSRYATVRACAWLKRKYEAAQGFQLEALEALLDDAEHAVAISGDEPYQDLAGRPASVLANVPAAIAYLRASLRAASR